MSLSPAETYALQLLAAQNGGPLPTLPEGMWPAVRDELQAQAVLGYPQDVVGKLGLSAAQQNEYLSYMGTCLSQWYSLMLTEDAVVGTLQAAGIAVAVLKGAAAAQHYDHPTGRAMGDIDIIVKPADFPRALALLEGEGWKNTVDLECYARHAGLEKPGCTEVELHQFFSTTSNVDQAQALDQAIYAGLDNVHQVQVEGFTVPVLPPLENGLVLLAHINQHLSSGLGLRQILDWQCFVAAHLTDQLWENGFQQAARAVGMEKLAVTVTALCRNYLGLSAALTWCNDADPALVDDLLAYIMSKGNMGRKENHGTQSTLTVLHKFTSPASALRYLYTGGRTHWAPARRHKWLAPAAVLYQVGHLARKGLARGVNASTLQEEAAAAQTEINLLERLGVTRM